jgi:membrane protein DedA with SNARE-associated domain
VLARVIGAERLHGLVDRHGIFYVCLARLVPTLRSIVPIPAGLLAMPLLPFLGWSLLGTFAWTSTLTLAGLFPGQRFPEVRAVVDWGSIGVTGLLLGWYLWRVARWHRS